MPDGRNLEEKFLEYAQVLLADAGVMHSMLSELGPGFVICHFFDERTNETQAREIADFLAPNEVLAGHLRNSILRNAHQLRSSNGDIQFPDASYVTERIQRKLSVIEEQKCGTQAFRRKR